MKPRRPRAARARSLQRSSRRNAASRFHFERLEVRRLLAGDVQFRFEFTDLAEGPLSSVGVGDEFLLRTFVQDVRTTPQGVSSAYVDFVFDNPLARSSGDPIEHGPDYATETSGDSSQFPRIEDVGGGLTGGIAPGAPEQEFLLFELPLVAEAAGTFSFHPAMADGFGRDILLVGSGTPVSFEPENVMLAGPTSLEIVPTIAFESATSHAGEADGTHTVNVVLDTGGATLDEAVTVNITDLPGSTAGPGDYSLATTSVTFAAGSSGGTQPVTINLTDDATGDGNVQVDLALTSVSSSSVGLGHLDRHRATIVDDDLDRVEFQVNLYADQGGEPGVILTENTITAGSRFFVEIVVGDYRDDPVAPGEQRGVIGVRIDDFTWPTSHLVNLNTFPIDNPLDLLNPNPLVTPAFPLSRSAALVDVPTDMQAVTNLTGFSNPTGGQGAAIGINEPQRFSLLHFVANDATAGPINLPLNVDTDTVALADNSDASNFLVQQPAVEVNDLPVAGNDLFSVDLNSNAILLDVLANDSDPQGSDLEITSVTPTAAGGMVMIVGTPGTPGHQIQYTPPADLLGIDTFAYTIGDGEQLGQATAQVTVEVGSLRIEKATNAADPANPTTEEDGDAAPGALVPTGTGVTWTYRVFNDGSRPLAISEVVDDFGTPMNAGDDFEPAPVEDNGENIGDSNSNGLLDPGEVWRYTSAGARAYTVVEGQYTNRALVTAGPADSGEVLSAEDPSNHFGFVADIALRKLTNGQEANAPTGPLLATGGMVTFDYEVTVGAGNVPLAVISLVDDNGTPGDAGDDFNPAPVETGGINDGDTNLNGRLDPGETWLFQAVRTVTAGQHTNTATVTANPLDLDGNDLPDTSDVVGQDDSNHFGYVTGVEVQKLTDGQDADDPTGPVLEVGQAVTFDYEVTVGAGNVPLTILSLVDDNGTPGDTSDDFNPAPLETGGVNNGDANSNGRLDPGETWLFRSAGVVTAGQYTNTAVVTANPLTPDGDDLPDVADVTDQDSSNHFGSAAGVEVQKSTNGQDADDPSGPLLAVGETVTFDYEVTVGDGNLPLAIVSLVDDNGTPGDTSDDFNPAPLETDGNNNGDTNTNGRLDPGEIWLYQATATVAAGQYTNTAVVTASPLDLDGNILPDEPNVTDQDSSNHFGFVAGVAVEKSTNGQDADDPSGPLLAVGEMVTFDYQVTVGAGNVPLSIVSLVDDNGTPGDTSDDFNPAPLETGGNNNGDTNTNGRLDPGETWLYQATATVTAGQYTNTAVVTANPLDLDGSDLPDEPNVIDQDSSNHFGFVAEVAVEKSTNGQDAEDPSGPLLAVGETVTFDYEVTVGEGNLPLDIVSLVDDNGTPQDTSDDFNPAPLETDGNNNGDTNANGRLDPGETWLFQATGTVTAGQYTNTAVVTANPLDLDGSDLPGEPDVTAQDSSNHFGFVVGIDIEKLTNGQDADDPSGPLLAVGETVTFDYQVTVGAGNVPLSIVTLVDDNGTPQDTGDDFNPTPLETGGNNVGDTNTNGRLDPGETWLFQATATVTAGQYTNTAVVTANPLDLDGSDLPGEPNATEQDSSNHFGYVTGVAIQKLTNGVDADDPPGPPVGVGEIVVFDYQVSVGAGNVPVTILSVVDDNGTPGDANDDFAPDPVEAAGFNVGDSNTNGRLDPGEVWQYQAMKTATPGQYTNIGVVTANPLDLDGNDLPDEPDVTDQDSSNHLGNPIRVEKATNAADPANPTAAEDADAAPGVYVPVGAPVVWTYLVSNGASEPLALTGIVDDAGTPGDTSDDFTPLPVPASGPNAGDTNQNGLIDMGEFWQFTSAGVLSYSAVAGQYANQVRVTADIPSSDGSAEDTDPSNHFGFVADVELRKLTNGQVVENPLDLLIPVGETATFDYEVTVGTGNLPLDVLSLLDDNGTPGDTSDDFAPAPVETGGINDGDTDGDGRLDPGETWLYRATRVVTPGDYTNQAVVTANPLELDGSDLAGEPNVTDQDGSDHFGYSVDVDLRKRTNGLDASSAPGPLLAVGDTVTFDYEVTAGAANVPLNVLSLVDDNGTPGDTSDDFNPAPLLSGQFNVGDLNGNGFVDPGETWQYRATDIVIGGPYANTAVVTADPLNPNGDEIPDEPNVTAEDTSNHFGYRVDVDLQKRTNGADADDPSGPLLALGETVTFDYGVSVGAGNLPLEVVSLLDDNGTPGNTADDFMPNPVETGGVNDGDTNGNGRLDPGETWLFRATSTVVAGQYTNTAVVTANPLDLDGNDLPDEPDVTDQDSSNHFGFITAVELQKLTNGQDADSPPGLLVPVGETATFDYEVSVGAGNVPLEIISVVDDNGTPGDTSDDFMPAPVETGGVNDGDANTNGRLDPGETWLFRATGTVTAGQYTNTATVTANPLDLDGNDLPDEPDVTDEDSSSHFGYILDLEIQKLTNGEDADDPSGPLLAVGETVTFDYQVSNPTGNLPLVIVSVLDDNGTPGDTSDDFMPAPVETGGINDGDTDGDGQLDPGETWLFQATSTVTAGQYTNTATVTANPLDLDGEDLAGEPDLTDQDPSNHFGYVADVELQKLTEGQDADDPPGPLLGVGDPVTFTYEVSVGAGNVPLEIVSLVDDAGTPGDTSDDILPDPVESGAFNVGDTNNNGRLDPGETWLFQAAGTVTPGQYTNTAVVTANPLDLEGNDLPDQSDVTDEDSSNHQGNPLRIEKATNAADPSNPTEEEDADTAPGRLIAVGESVVWTYLVTNQAAEPLSLTGIIDDAGTPLDASDDFSPLPVPATGTNVGDLDADGLVDLGEVWQFTSVGAASHSAEAGQYTNQVRATADIPSTSGTAEDTDSSNHFGFVADVQLTKQTNGQDADNAPGPLLAVGETVTFDYQVSVGAGNVPLNALLLADDNGTPGDTSDDFNPAPVETGGFNAGDTNANGLLDPGETWLFQATATVIAGQYTNTATVSANPLDLDGNDLPDQPDVTDQDSSNHFGYVTAVEIQKLTEGQDADSPTGPLLAVGETVTFDYQVTVGTGNVPLDILTLVDDNGTPGDTSDDFSPDPLETGGVNDGDTNDNGLLDPGETWLFRATSVVVAGQYTNTAVVTANPLDLDGNDLPDEAAVTDQDSSNHFGFTTGVELQKLTNGEDADDPPGPVLQSGDTATFDYEVTVGAGNLPLEIVSLMDDNGTPDDTSDDFSPDPVETDGVNDGDADGNGLVDPGETWLFRATRTVTVGQYTNTATVTANPVDFDGNDVPDLDAVTDADSSNHLGEAPDSSISGSAYVDTNGNGVRDTLANGQLETGIPGVLIVLFDASGMQIAEVRTDDGGNYTFDMLGFGTYTLVQAQPVAFLDGETSAGSFGGIPEVNRIRDIVIDAEGGELPGDGSQGEGEFGDGTGYDFGEAGIRPEYISKRMFLASSPPIDEILRMLVEAGEDPIEPPPAPAVAAAGADGNGANNGGGEGEGPALSPSLSPALSPSLSSVLSTSPGGEQSADLGSSLLADDLPFFPGEGEGEFRGSRNVEQLSGSTSPEVPARGESARSQPPDESSRGMPPLPAVAYHDTAAGEVSRDTLGGKPAAPDSPRDPRAVPAGYSDGLPGEQVQGGYHQGDRKRGDTSPLDELLALPPDDHFADAVDRALASDERWRN